MKIAIIGYGKMGKEIERVILDRGHTVVGKATKSQPISQELIQGADIAIDFSTPYAVQENILFALKHHLPIVVGTTGWHNELAFIQKQVAENNGALLYASNFSIGVNLFFQLNENLAKLMASQSDYFPEITEIHHTEKLDAPSGTAISLAGGIIENRADLENWELKKTPATMSEDKKARCSSTFLPIKAIREKDINGIHEITYSSEIDEITIRHEAFSRTGFALGAVVAAEWLQNKKGIFTMKDVLQLS